MGAKVKVITRAVLDWDGHILEEDAYEYSGPIALAKDSGSAPQPTDPWTQAAAQYALDTGTANYNAGLTHTNSSNPLGSNTWNITGYTGSPTGSPASPGHPATPSPAPVPGAPAPGPGQPGYTSSPYFGFGGGMTGYQGTPTAPGLHTGPGGGGGVGSIPGINIPGTSTGSNIGSGAPIYSQNTSLSPWANQLLQSPIDTSGIPGMPGGPSEQQNVNSAENATFANEMQLMQPQMDQQREQNQAQLEAEGAMPGSAAYEYGTKMLGLTQGAQTANAANQAVTTGMGELPMLYGLGSTSLQNQLATRNAPISEYEALQGNPSSQVSAATPDISGAFGQQYQGRLAGYNADTATNNANTGAATSALMMAALYAGSAF